MKFDTGKPPINLVPSAAIVAAAQVFAFGAQKYGENNWRRDLNKFPLSRHYASIQRHLLAWNEGEDIDPESGLPHLHHAMTQLMILSVCQVEATTQVDDRFKKDMIDDHKSDAARQRSAKLIEILEDYREQKYDNERK